MDSYTIFSKRSKQGVFMKAVIIGLMSICSSAFAIGKQSIDVKCDAAIRYHSSEVNSTAPFPLTKPVCTGNEEDCSLKRAKLLEGSAVADSLGEFVVTVLPAFTEGSLDLNKALILISQKTSGLKGNFKMLSLRTIIPLIETPIVTDLLLGTEDTIVDPMSISLLVSCQKI